MKFEKKKLLDMNRCYSVAAINTWGEDKIFFATEGEGKCVAFSGPDFAREETVWEGPGGCMGMVPVPGRKGDFLAVQKFLRMFQWEEACLVWVEALEHGGWKAHELFTLPYLHRFDILTAQDGRSYLICCTIAQAKETKEDWSKPGSIFVAPMPTSWTEKIELRPLRNDLFQNHGYCRGKLDGSECGLVGAREGVFAVIPPQNSGQDWEVRQLLNAPAGDVAVTDLDGDGKLEMAVIDGFHGNGFSVYRQNGGAWNKIYEDPDHSAFYHVAWGGKLGGVPAFIAGCRRGSQELFALTCENGAFTRRVIEAGTGPSNATAADIGGQTWVISANREIAEGAVYLVGVK